MFDSARILEPLDEERDKLERLDAYRSPAELRVALAAAAAVVEQTLRRLLRQDATAPDELRLIALSAEQLPYDRLIPALTKSNRISLALAGEAHELRRTAERAASGDVRAADADAACAVLDRLRREIVALSAAESTSQTGGTAASGIGTASRLDWQEEPAVVKPPDGRPERRRLWLYAAAAVVLVLAVWVVWPRGSPMAAGIEAFPDRLGVAEREFLTVLGDEPENVTARLYLGRIYRLQARYEEAAEMLRLAADAAPADADVRRELGYLFLDLDRPTSAVEQFRRAQQADPENDLNWIGLIRALRIAGDPEADVVLSRAPADVRAVFLSNPPSGTD